MSRQFGPKTCDHCFAVIEGRVGNYCDADCERADLEEHRLQDADPEEEDSDETPEMQSQGPFSEPYPNI